MEERGFCVFRVKMAFPTGKTGKKVPEKEPSLHGAKYKNQ